MSYPGLILRSKEWLERLKTREFLAILTLERRQLGIAGMKVDLDPGWDAFAVHYLGLQSETNLRRVTVRFDR